MLAEDRIILSSDEVADLPLYYRYAARHLAQTGRAVIRESSEKQEEA